MSILGKYLMRLCERLSKINCDIEANMNIIYFLYTIMLVNNNLRTLTMGYKTLRSMMANLECRNFTKHNQFWFARIKCAKSTTSSKCMKHREVISNV